MAVSPRIALVGKSGAGKSAVATIISEKYGHEHVRTGQICRLISNLLFGDESKRHTQMLDDALVPLEPSIFLKATLRNVRLDQPLVIDSLRFITDVQIARDLGCRIIRVTASDDLRSTRLRARGQAFDIRTDGLHRSETELDQALVDGEVHNSSSTQELITRVMERLAHL